VFAERWTPLTLREPLAGSHRFSQLQRGLPGIPRACWHSGWDPCSAPG
jgi:DNA-binding HxlR family transcriptional regulator